MLRTLTDYSLVHTSATANATSHGCFRSLCFAGVEHSSPVEIYSLWICEAKIQIAYAFARSMNRALPSQNVEQFTNKSTYNRHRNSKIKYTTLVLLELSTGVCELREKGSSVHLAVSLSSGSDQSLYIVDHCRHMGHHSILLFHQALSFSELSPSFGSDQKLYILIYCRHIAKTCLESVTVP